MAQTNGRVLTTLQDGPLYPCPTCGKELNRGRAETGNGWTCADGHGSFLTWSSLEASLGPDLCREIWRKARDTKERTGSACVGCGQPMVLVSPRIDTSPFPFCTDCRMGWCTTAGLESMKQPPAPQPDTAENPGPIEKASQPVSACPDCGVPLQKGRNDQGLFWACPAGHGWSLSLSSLRQRTAPETLIPLWSQIRSGTSPAGRSCPLCGHASRTGSLSEGGPSAEICPACQAGWFTAAFLQVLPPPPPPPAPDKAEDKMPEEAKRLLAEAQIRQIAERHRDKSTLGAPDHLWQYLLGFLGLPIRLGEDTIEIVPWASIGLGAAVFVISAACFLGPTDFLIEALGMVPGDLWRLGGLSVLTCFFVHADWFHLLGNLYMMALVAPKCEQDLGHRRLILLLAFSLLGSNLLDLLFHPSPMMPRIGASGGIAGLLAYFAFRFPGARFGFLIPIRFMFLKLPALAFIILWIFFQILGSAQMMEGKTYVNHLAHLGGALTGIALWWAWRPKEPEE